MGGHEDRSHRRWSPSQSERFFNCPGSARQIDKSPAREQSEYAKLGTKAHEVLDVALQNKCRSAMQSHREYSTYFAEEFDDDFFTSIQDCLDYVYDILDEHADAVLYNERFVDPPLSSDPGEAGGYCDIAIHVPSLRLLYIIDYKHGAGIAKAANGNTQVKQYGAGFLYEDDPVVDPAQIDLVICVIVQPRAFHADGPIREARITPFDLYVYLDELDASVQACMDPNAPLIPGEWCSDTFCPARTTCPAREAFGLAKVSEHFKSVKDITEAQIPNVKNLDLFHLSSIAHWRPFLVKFLNDVDEHLKELMQAGVDVPGFKLVATQSRREWFGEPEDIAQRLAALAGVPVEEVLKPKLLGITEAEKLVVDKYKERAGRGKKKQAAEEAKLAFAFFTTKQSSGITIAPEGDPRPALDRAKAFTGVAGLIEAPK